MSKLLQQLQAFSEIRKLVAKHFVGADFYYVETALMNFLDLEVHQEWEFDKDKEVYVVLEHPSCKVCHSVNDSLTEIPLAHGSFHICHGCHRDIASAS